MRFIKHILFTILFTLSFNVFACINEYRTLLNGEVIYTDPTSGKIWQNEIDTLNLRIKSNNLLVGYQQTKSIENYSDYGASLIYLGEFYKAIEVYEEIESLAPNLYTTASNLGTIYELIGNLELAIEWIKKSIDLNPQSHAGSEWIHLKILEFKIKQTSDHSKSILALDFGSTHTPSNHNAYNLQELKTHIWHQLKERSKFVKPINKIVGNIYFDLGNILALSRDLESAIESYEAAQEYGYKSELLTQRLEVFKYMTQKAKSKQGMRSLQLFIRDNLKIFFWSGLTFLALLILLIRKIKKVLINQNALKHKDSSLSIKLGVLPIPQFSLSFYLNQTMFY